MVVTIRVPPRAGCAAFSFAIVVEADRVVSAPRGATWMVGWPGASVRKFCQDVQWQAMVPKNAGARAV